MTVSANVAEGVQTAKVQQEIAGELAKADLGPGVTFKLKGEDEERDKAGAFLMKAFGTAIFLIFAILLAQFNKLTSVGLVLTAVVLSTFGVLLGLLVMGQAFGVVMTGIGVIANAGVIVNNNIVLIDTYDRLRREGVEAYEAILETCRERARPVVLTAVTAILGVLPIAFGMNVEFLSREITVGAPATQWWINLSTAIVFGLGFATVLTLIVTPAALMAIENMRERRLRLFAALRTRRPLAARLVDRAPSRSLRLDAGVLDHLRPFGDLGGDESLHLLRRAGQRRDGEAFQLVLGFGLAEEAHQHLVELVDDRARRRRAAPPPRTSRSPRSPAARPPRASADPASPCCASPRSRHRPSPCLPRSRPWRRRCRPSSSGFVRRPRRSAPRRCRDRARCCAFAPIIFRNISMNRWCGVPAPEVA